MGQSSFANQPSRNFAALAESDVTVLSGDLKGVYCLTSGNCVVDNWGDVESTIPMVAGQSLAINPKRLKVASTGTYMALR